MDGLERPNLRTVGSSEGAAASVPSNPGLGAFGVNANAELVGELIGTSGLLSEDRIAQVRSRATQTRSSFAQALLDEGLATSEGLARLLATRHGLPFVELAFTGVDNDVAKLIPLHVLERVAALPYALKDNTLHVAIPDPANVHA